MQKTRKASNAQKSCTRKANKALKLAIKYAKHGKTMTKKQKNTLVSTYKSACVKNYGKTAKKVNGHWKWV